MHFFYELRSSEFSTLTFWGTKGFFQAHFFKFIVVKTKQVINERPPQSLTEY